MYFKPLPSRALIAHLFTYDPETGDMCWRVRHHHMCSQGVISEDGPNHGYRVVTFYKHTWLQHRLIWKLMTGEDPDPAMALDHINEDPGDNRWSNIRQISVAENIYRSSKYTRAPHREVWLTNKGKWGAKVSQSAPGRGTRTLYHIGTFETKAEAEAAPDKPYMQGPPVVQARQVVSGQWEARVWDRKLKKKVHLGTFNTQQQALLALARPAGTS